MMAQASSSSSSSILGGGGSSGEGAGGGGGASASALEGVTGAAFYSPSPTLGGARTATPDSSLSEGMVGWVREGDLAAVLLSGSGGLPTQLERVFNEGRHGGMGR